MSILAIHIIYKKLIAPLQSHSYVAVLPLELWVLASKGPPACFPLFLLIKQLLILIIGFELFFKVQIQSLQKKSGKVKYSSVDLVSHELLKSCNILNLS